LNGTAISSLFIQAVRRPWTAVTLWVLEANQRARRFYEALDFSLDGAERTQTSLIGAPLHEVRYRKSVNPETKKGA